MRLVLRADGGGLRGSGHVMRALALAEVWRAGGGAVRLASCALPPALAARAAALGVGIVDLAAAPGSAEDADATRAAAAGAAALAIDGYVFDSAYLDRLDGAAPVLVIDDAAALPRYRARWILNQNAHAAAALYDGRAPGAVLLLGGAYALLRGEFVDLPRPDRRSGLFATFGGVDPHGASLRFLDAFEAAGLSASAGIAIGAANPQAHAIARRALDCGVVPLHDVRDMGRRLAAAALVVTAGGSTLWEGCAAGAPMLVVSVIAEEALGAAALDALGGCRHLGRLSDVTTQNWAAALRSAWADDALRAALSARAGLIADGRGAERVARLLAAETSR